MKGKLALAALIAWITISGTLFAIIPARAGLPGSATCSSNPGGICQWTVDLDASSVCNVNSLTPTCTDTAVQTSATNTHSFLVGTIVNASGGVAPAPAICGQQCITSLFGWQFEIVYDNTSFVPQADPILGTATDYAAPTVIFGGQTTSGNPNWNGMIVSGSAFGSFVILPVDATHQKIRVFFAVLAPNSAVSVFPQITSTHTVTGNLLANVAFETRRVVTNAQFSLTGVKFVNMAADTILTNCGLSSCPPAVVAGSSITETVTNDPPVARFTATQIPNGDPSCLPVTGVNCSAFAWRFDATASSDSDGTIANPAGDFWDFGDGSQDNVNVGAACTLTTCNQGPIAIHDYGTSGSFTVSLRVVDDMGATGSARDPLGNSLVNKQQSHWYGTIPNAQPKPRFSINPFNPVSNALTVFDAAATTDDGFIVTYAWDFGDSGTASGLNVTHIYSTAGTYTVMLTVTDNLGLTNSTSQSLNVAATFTTSFSVNPATPVQEFFANFTATATGGTTPYTSYTWDFGDGTGTATGVTVSHVFSSTGTFMVNLTVVDSGSRQSKKSISVTVVADTPPSITITPPNGITAGQSFSLTLSITDSDQGLGKITGVKIDWGDQNVTTYTTGFTSVAHTYTNSGNFVINITATDNGGKISTKATTVTVAAPLPSPGLPGGPIPYIIIAVIVGAIVAIFIIRRRKPKPQQAPSPKTR